MPTQGERIELALDLLLTYGSEESPDAKAWVIDQVTRALQTKRQYKDFVALANTDPEDEDRDAEVKWSTGVRPEDD